MTNLDSILKTRDITLLAKVHIDRAIVFPVVMRRCENWTIKKAECWRIDAFELWCWRKLLRVPWTSRRSNQSILKENHSWIFTGRTDAEAPIVWPPNVKSRLIWKDPDAGKYWGQEEKGVTEDKMAGWHNWLNGHKVEQTPQDREAWRAAVHGVTKSQTQISNWTTTNYRVIRINKKNIQY